MKKGFVLYNDQYEPIKALSQEQKGDLLDAIFQYQRDGTQPENGTMVSMAFSFFKIAFDRDEDKYLKRCEKNRENARIRWDATACDGIRMNAKHADRGSERDRDTDRDTKEQQPLFDEPEPPPKKAKQKYDDDYQTFYEEYPKKSGKGQGQTTWRKLNESGKILGLERMLEVLRGFIYDNWQETDKKYIPNISTWLNDGSFMDQHKSDSQQERDKAKSIINWDTIAKIKAGET